MACTGYSLQAARCSIYYIWLYRLSWRQLQRRCWNTGLILNTVAVAIMWSNGVGCCLSIIRLWKGNIDASRARTLAAVTARVGCWWRKKTVSHWYAASGASSGSCWPRKICSTTNSRTYVSVPRGHYLLAWSLRITEGRNCPDNIVSSPWSSSVLSFKVKLNCRFSLYSVFSEL